MILYLKFFYYFFFVLQYHENIWINEILDC